MRDCSVSTDKKPCTDSGQVHSNRATSEHTAQHRIHHSPYTTHTTHNTQYTTSTCVSSNSSASAFPLASSSDSCRCSTVIASVCSCRRRRNCMDQHINIHPVHELSCECPLCTHAYITCSTTHTHTHTHTSTHTLTHTHTQHPAILFDIYITRHVHTYAHAYTPQCSQPSAPCCVCAP